MTASSGTVCAETTIRRARRDDVPRIVELILRGGAAGVPGDVEIADEVLRPEYGEAFQRLSAGARDLLFVAERDGQVVGTFQMTLIPGLVARGRVRAKLESVHVAAAFRGNGIGADMVHFAIAEARRQGAGLVELTSNKSRLAAHRFYRRLGFEQSHEGFKLTL